jgi:hypothetical protein
MSICTQIKVDNPETESIRKDCMSPLILNNDSILEMSQYLSTIDLDNLSKAYPQYNYIVQSEIESRSKTIPDIGEAIKVGDLYFVKLYLSMMSPRVRGGLLSKYTHMATKHNQKIIADYFIDTFGDKDLLTYAALTGALEAGLPLLTRFYFDVIKNAYPSMTTAKDQKSPYFFAIKSGRVDFIRYVESIGIVSNNINRDLFVACRYSHIELIELFDSRGSKNWNEAMLGAAKGGNLEAFTYCISRGGNLFKESYEIAINSNHVDIPRYIRERNLI